jgi:hypothetical protein
VSHYRLVFVPQAAVSRDVSVGVVVVSDKPGEQGGLLPAAQVSAPVPRTPRTFQSGNVTLWPDGILPAALAMGFVLSALAAAPTPASAAAVVSEIVISGTLPDGTGPVATPVLSDEFTGSGALTAHTSDSGHTWTDTSDKFFFDGGTAGDASCLTLSGGVVGSVQADSSFFPCVVSNAVLPADQAIEVHVLGNPDGHSDYLLGLRYNPSTGAGYFFGVNFGPASGSGDLSCYLQSSDGAGGFEILLDGGTPIHVANANDYVLRVEITGSLFKISVDGVDVTPPKDGGGTLESTLVTAAGSAAFCIETNGLTHFADVTFDSLTAGSITAGTPYSATLTASGGTAPYTWSAIGLPPGLTINASTGEVSGTPTTAGSYSATVTATDSLGAHGSRVFPITIT